MRGAGTLLQDEVTTGDREAMESERSPPALKLRATAGRPPHVVIVGAGFGGLAAAKRLSNASVDLTVIDRRNHHLFQPLLYQVATAALSPADIAAPIRSVLRDARHTSVLLDEVTAVDPPRRSVVTSDGGRIQYDYLVLAIGSDYNYFGNAAAWRAVAPGVKTLEDAVEIRRRLLLAFERAECTRDEALRRRLMTFVLVGAGPTGVEMAGALAELARAALARDFRHIDTRAARILLIEAGPRILPAFVPDQSEYGLKTLSRMGVEVMLNTMIERIDADGVVANGEPIVAETVIWCAGVEAGPVGAWLGAEMAPNGAVKVCDDLSVPGHPDIFVIGDAAWVTDAAGHPLPGLAPVAKQQGQYVADLIRRRIADRPPGPPFRYRDRGKLATIGRSAAIVDVAGIRLKGFIGWVVWGLAHIYFLIGFRNRIAVFTDWLWSWLTYARGARLIIGSRAALSETPYEASGERSSCDRP